jgi:hypothetical protein
MAAKTPHKKLPSPPQARTGGADGTCAHAVYSPLRDLIVVNAGAQLKQILSQQHLQAFGRLKHVRKKHRTTALKGQGKAAAEALVDWLEKRGVDTAVLRAAIEGRKDTEPGSVVTRYLAHAERQIEKVRADPVHHLMALEAKAKCLEFARRWDEAIGVLGDIIRIEDEDLCDPVEAARTRTRAAKAHIEMSTPESYLTAEKLLNDGLDRLSNFDGAHRTRLELLLTLGHVYLRLRRPEECQRILENDCAPLLAVLRGNSNSRDFPALRADYAVRLGVALKVQKELTKARAQLVHGALTRARLANFLGTAHAVRHLGGLYASCPEWVEAGDSFRRSLWFYLAAMSVFREEGDLKNEARTHCNCGNVLSLMLSARSELTDQSQVQALQHFANNLHGAFDGEEKELVVEIRKKYSSPHSSGGPFKFVQPYRRAAAAHYRACIELEGGLGFDGQAKEARKRLEHLESDAVR